MPKTQSLTPQQGRMLWELYKWPGCVIGTPNRTVLRALQRKGMICVVGWTVGFVVTAAGREWLKGKEKGHV